MRGVIRLTLKFAFTLGTSKHISANKVKQRVLGDYIGIYSYLSLLNILAFTEFHGIVSQ